MSPYDIPLSVINEFVSTRFLNSIDRLGHKTVNDLINHPSRYIMYQRNVGAKTLTEFHELQKSLIQDIDVYVKIAAEKGLIDIRDIIYEPNRPVSACFKLIDPNSLSVPESLRHLFTVERVASLQDILLISHVTYENRILNRQSDLAPYKRSQLQYVQEHILNARNAGNVLEEPIICSEQQLELISSAILIDSVPMPISIRVRSLLNELHVSTLYEVSRIWRFPYHFIVSPESKNEVRQYQGELKSWLNAGAWTSLNFFPKN